LKSKQRTEVITERTFRPNAFLTRGDLIRFLARATCGLDIAPYSKEPSRFSDVSDDSEYKAYLNWAYAEGIITGYGDGTFRPEKNISREEVCATIIRYLEYYKAFRGKTDADITFADEESFAAWSGDYIHSLTRQGLIKGIPTNDGRVAFMPKKEMTYAEIATILRRILTALQ